MPRLYPKEELRELRRQIETLLSPQQPDGEVDANVLFNYIRSIEPIDPLILLTSHHAAIRQVCRMPQLEDHFVGYLPNSGEDFVFAEEATVFDKLAAILFYAFARKLLNSSERGSEGWKRGCIFLDVAAKVYLCKSAEQELQDASDGLVENIHPMFG